MNAQNGRQKKVRKKKKERTTYAGRKIQRRNEETRKQQEKQIEAAGKKDSTGGERSVKEKMKKSVAAVMGIAISAALLLGGCTSNTTDETKAGSSADTSDVTSASDLDSLQTSDPQKGQAAGAQDSDAPDAEAQDLEASAGAAEFTPGTYIGDGESITLTEADGALTFSFAQAGITGTATIEKDAAVYSGDDDHQIEFRQDGTILTVTVTGVQGEESDSPLAGTYVKEAD